MASAPTNSLKAYNIQFSPKAWAQTGSFDLATFQRVRAALKELAAQATRMADPRETTEGLRRALTLARPGFLVTCEIDHQTRTLTLLEVQRRLPRAE